MKFPVYRTGIGQSSHRFLPSDSSKPCVVAGVMFDDVPGLDSESDGDVVFHAFCQAVSSLTGVQILSGIAQELCRKDGITDSAVYVERALRSLGEQKIVHVAFSIEGKRPHFQEKIAAMRRSVARLIEGSESQVGIVVTSGEGLTDFGCGDGLQCFCSLTVVG